MEMNLMVGGASGALGSSQNPYPTGVFYDMVDRGVWLTGAYVEGLGYAPAQTVILNGEKYDGVGGQSCMTKSEWFNAQIKTKSELLWDAVEPKAPGITGTAVDLYMSVEENQIRAMNALLSSASIADNTLLSFRIKSSGGKEYLEAYDPRTGRIIASVPW